MGSPLVYLDWAATAIPDPESLKLGLESAITFFGNPSSAHSAGKQATAILEEARSSMLDNIASSAGGFVFTGSGSEADTIPFLSLLGKSAVTGTYPFCKHRESGNVPVPHIIASSIEHSAIDAQLSILEKVGFSVTRVHPGKDGLINPDAFSSALKPETRFATVMAVNNETGAIQPIASIIKGLKEKAQSSGWRTPFIHSDAIQALGKIPFNPHKLGLDSAAFSAHKIQGPRGVGALWLKRKLEPFIVGGGQEQGMRPGTENLQGIVAFSAATRKIFASSESSIKQARQLECHLFTRLESIQGARILPEERFCNDPRYSPYIFSIAFRGLSGEVMQRALSDMGIAVSTGSACSTRSGIKGRRILSAMGVDDETALTAIRISTGKDSTPADIDCFAEAVRSILSSLSTKNQKPGRAS